MKTNLIRLFLLILSTMPACQSATPAPAVIANANAEFSLAPGQSAVVADTDLTITFHSIRSDERCPIEIECVVSGPATLSLSVQQGNDLSSNVTLQTFTDNDGRSPKVEFEGIQDRLEVGEYLLQVVGVLPYPKNLSETKASAYRVTFTVGRK
jgi:hypothetical protein